MIVVLFLSKMVNNDEFIKSLQECTSQCLSNDKKTVDKYHYFKHNLLNSKVWSLSKDSSNVNTVKNTQSNSNNNNNTESLLLDEIELNVISMN